MKKISVIFFVVICLILISCGKKTNDNKDEKKKVNILESNMIYMYYPEDNKVVAADDLFQLKQPDSTAASIEEIMMNIMNYFDGSLVYNTYMLDSNNYVSLEFTLFGEYDNVYYLLAKSAIVRTLYQLNDIKNIKIVLYNEAGEVIKEESLERDSIYYYDDEIGE